MTTPESRTVEERDSLWDRVQKGGTPLLEKLAALSDEEWAELTHRMQKHFQRELRKRHFVIVPEDADAKEHGLVIGEGELDRAWKEAEEALLEGWRLRLSRTDEDFDVWEASAVSPAFFNGENDNDAEYEHGYGPTPTAALQALTVKLRESRR